MSESFCNTLGKGRKWKSEHLIRFQRKWTLELKGVRRLNQIREHKPGRPVAIHSNSQNFKINKVLCVFHFTCKSDCMSRYWKIKAGADRSHRRLDFPLSASRAENATRISDQKLFFPENVDRVCVILRNKNIFHTCCVILRFIISCSVVAVSII